MERGEEEAARAAMLHLSAAISADEQARGFRRANAGNCRPAIVDARAPLREQRGSTPARRHRRHLNFVPIYQQMETVPITALSERKSKHRRRRTLPRRDTAPPESG